MLTPRYVPLHPGEPFDSLKNIDLIITCLQDPKGLEIINPSLRDAEKLIAHIGASVHPAVIAMIWDSLRDNQPLDKCPISLTTPTSQATIEEKETLVWHNDTPTVCREIAIRRLSPSECSTSAAEEANSHDAEDEHHLEVTLSRTETGEVCIGLQWEEGREAESTASRIARWEKIEAVFKLLGEDPTPGNLRPFAVEKGDKDEDDIYVFRNVRLYATLFPAELVELELELETKARTEQQALDGCDTDSDDMEGWKDSSYSSEFDAEEEGDDEGFDEEEPDEPLDPYPASPSTQDRFLTILGPTPLQISKIANLSEMPVTTGIIEDVMACALKGRALTPQAFDDHASSTLNDLAISRRTIFTMDRSLRTTHSYGLIVHTTPDALPDPSLSISLSLERLPLPGEQPFIKSVFEWTSFSDLSTIQHWNEILRIAKERA